jgi:peptidyl-prolyl cis-trans isomerase D
MRKHARYFYFLFGIVIISFIFFYTGVDQYGQNSNPVLAEVAGERIYLDEYWRIYDRLRDFYREIYEKSFDEKMEEELNIKQKALDMLIEERLLLMKAGDIGLQVTDDELQESIMNDPSFLRDGIFKREIYLRTLQLNRLNPRYFESMKRRELLLKKIRALIVEAIALSDEDVKDFQGDKKFLETFEKALLEDKREKMVKSYVETLKKQLNVTVNSELIL